VLEDWQMSAPEIEAIQERLKKLRADEVLVAEQLDRLQAQKAALEHRHAMIQGAIQVLEEMRQELEP
jgi:predicted nuclease with TOPRIM domain